MPRKKAPSWDEDHELIRRSEKKLLDRIAVLSEMVLRKRGYGSGYEKGMKPPKELALCLTDLEILRARHA